MSSYEGTSGNNYQWWAAKPNEVHNVLMPYIKALELNQSVRRQHAMQFARLYQNQSPTYRSSISMANTLGNETLSQWTSRNVIKSCIDTATSKIGKSKPRPVFQTEGGVWSERNRAQNLTQFLDGSFANMKIYDKGAEIFRDGGIFGIGHLKFFVNEELGEVNCERVLPDEIIVDDADAIYGTPRQMHHRKYVSRAELIKKYPQHRRDIERAKPAFIDGTRMGLNLDLIKIVEGYLLPSKVGAGDGLKAICIDTVTLDRCEWEKPYFPFVAWRWCSRVTGYWGLGIAEELYGTQLEINNILRNIQVAQRLCSVPRIFVQNGSLVNSKIDNNIGAVVKYTGQAPTFSTPQSVNGEIYSHLQWLVQSSFEQIGVSQMSATGMVPAGMEAAVAMREYSEQTSERFMVVGQKWESFYLECARVTIDLTKDLETANKKPKIKTVDGKFMKRLDWKSVHLDEDKYTLRMLSANILPTTPAGKMAKVQELIQIGWIPREEGFKLLDFPDLDSYANKVLSSSNLTDKMIEAALDKGKYIAPEPEMKLQEALATAQERMLEAKLDGCPSRNMAVLARWMEAVKGLMPATPQVVNPMAPVDPAAGGIAQPEAPPVSDLAPFQ
jgi:hypothetical protein